MIGPPPAALSDDGADATWQQMLHEVRELLEHRGRLVVAGAWGTGKTTLLDSLASPQVGFAARRLLRIGTRTEDVDVPYGAIAQMLSLSGPDATSRPTAPQMCVLPGPDATSCPTSPKMCVLPGPDATSCPTAPRTCTMAPSSGTPGRTTPPSPAPCVPLTDLPGPQDGSERRLAVRLAVTEFLAGAGSTLLLIDGAAWIDAPSADVLSYALRTLPVSRLAAVACERTAAYPHAAADLLGGHPDVLTVPPLTVTDTSVLLAGASLPARWAAPVHRYCGGHRALTAAFLHAAASRPCADHAAPVWPAEVEDRARAWLTTVPGPVRATLQSAALTHHPDVTVLRNAGHVDAEDHLDQAEAAGLVTALGPHRFRFTAEAVAQAAASTGSSVRRAQLHRALAGAVADPVHRARHLALARRTADQDVALGTADAAAVARRDGDRVLAAELMALSADLTPAGRPQLRLSRLSLAARDAAAAGRAGLTQQIADAITASRGSRAQRVDALLAVVDVRGQDMTGLEGHLAEARRLAADDPALLAAVELRAAIQANVSRGAGTQALRHAEHAVRLARHAGDKPLQAAALTMRARMERLAGGHGRAQSTLAAALGLDVPPQTIGIRNSPQYLAARHALFDDRLARAREQLVALLPYAAKAGEAEDLVDLWRSLAETDTRLGSCATALQWAGQAVELTASAGLSPGPAWYTAALAHSNGGSFATAGHYAEQAVRASAEEQDTIHTARGLWILGSIRLHTGDTQGAAGTLARLAEHEATGGGADPGILRWQPDAIEAFAAARMPDEARALLDALPEHIGTEDERRTGLRAATARARAACLRLAGDGDAAAGLLAEAARLFASLDMPVEEGRTQLALGRLERGRRRQAAARTAWRRAETLFGQAEAAPWHALTAEALARLSGPGSPGPRNGHGPHQLSRNEHRLVGLIRAGASNREAADRMFLSVKTVESMLSRIYRKSGVRTRTQLLSRLADTPPA
ncbi:AAA family ATPase [Streptomyces sp. NPDC048111]|uniref:AAA family ATPase n=1 Tax=Streptomyces sp. NPDC048111 TaxID=3365500 RepID=UPI00371E6B77